MTACPPSCIMYVFMMYNVYVYDATPNTEDLCLFLCLSDFLPSVCLCVSLFVFPALVHVRVCIDMCVCVWEEVFMRTGTGVKFIWKRSSVEKVKECAGPRKPSAKTSVINGHVTLWLTVVLRVKLEILSSEKQAL